MSLINPCLKHVPIFENLEKTMLIKISKIISAKDYKANDVIYRENELVESLGIIHRGSVKLTKSNEDGKERIISILLLGDYFGESSLLVSQRNEFEVVALEDTTIHHIKLDDFRKLMLAHQDMTLSMLQSLIDQIANRDRAVVNESLVPAYDRVYDALLHYSDLNGLVNLPISKKDLANSLGITPETFSRTLNTLEKAQRIKREKADIFVI